MKHTENNADKNTDTSAADTPELDTHATATSSTEDDTQAATAANEVPLLEAAPEPSIAEPASNPSQTAPEQNNTPATWPGKLALAISIIALGASGYLYWQTLQGQENDSASITALKQEVSQAVASTKSQVEDAKALVTAQVASVNQNLTLLQSQSSKEQKGIEELQTRLTQSIQQVNAKQSNSRKDWLLAESEYLLRLANQRILMENTSQGALALLKSADKILQEADDVAIYPVRKALASDLAALEAIPTFDLEGSYLKLAALNEQVSKLRLIPLTDKNKLPSLIQEITPESVSESWTQGIQESWAKAVDKLEKLIVIQHRDEAIEPLLSPEQTYYLQQNLHLMLEQAQLALLQKNQTVFDLSLEKATAWTSTYFEEGDAATQALLRGLNELKALRIAPEMPDISGSLKALKTYLQELTKLKEEGAA